MSAPIYDTRPFSRFEWMLALRYLRARRKEGFVSVIAGFSFLGILLGVATLIVVMAVMNGFRNELLSKILGLDGHVIVIRLDDPDFPDYADYAKKLAAAPTVKHVIPLIESQVMVSTPAQSVGVKVRGISEEGLKALPLIANSIKGEFAGFDGQDGIVVGVGLMNLLHIKLGDSITFISPRGGQSHSPFGSSTPRIKAYKVVATFEMGMSDFDRSIVFMPLAEAQRYFEKKAVVDVLDVVVDDPARVERSVAAMKELGLDELRFVDWRQRNLSFFTVIQVQRNMMFIVLSIIVVVAAFNIISGLFMVVKDKGREIGILRTMGATQGAIMRVFLITGASIGVVGSLGGCLLGIVVSWRIDEIRRVVSWLTGTVIFDPGTYYLPKMPADLSWQSTGIVIVMALAFSFLATLYPSWRAARLDPVDALRYE
jgi:lipoprotein-releasing system permease protein